MRVNRAELVATARRYAHDHHGGALGRDGVSPYFEHVATVADLVAGAGGSDLLVSAAYLHDVVEDTDATIDQLVSRFGPRVASIVDHVTNEVVDTRTGLPLSWVEQKSLSIIALRRASREVIWLKAADLCANADELIGNLARFGPRAWIRYDAGPARQLGYYLCLGDELLERLDNTYLRERLTHRMAALRDVARSQGIRPAFPLLAPPRERA